MFAEATITQTTQARRTSNQYAGMLPIRPDMLAFIHWRENLQPGEPLLLPGSGAISNHLASIIEFGKSMYFPGANRIAPDNAELTAKLKFSAAPGLIDCSFFEYADLVAYYFNQFIVKHYLDSLATFVQAATFYNERLDSKDVLADFQRQTGVDMHREHDADIKAYYRLRLSRRMVTPRHKRGKG